MSIFTLKISCKIVLSNHIYLIDSLKTDKNVNMLFIALDWKTVVRLVNEWNKEQILEIFRLATRSKSACMAGKLSVNVYRILPQETAVIAKIVWRIWEEHSWGLKLIANQSRKHSSELTVWKRKGLGTVQKLQIMLCFTTFKQKSFKGWRWTRTNVKIAMFRPVIKVQTMFLQQVKQINYVSSKWCWAHLIYSFILQKKCMQYSAK